jgi:hypothetical protein
MFDGCHERSVTLSRLRRLSKHRNNHTDQGRKGHFGLLESRTEPRSAADLVERRLYRKAPLFDRFLKFDVQVEGPEIRH